LLESLKRGDGVSHKVVIKEGSCLPLVVSAMVSKKVAAEALQCLLPAAVVRVSFLVDIGVQFLQALLVVVAQGCSSFGSVVLWHKTAPSGGVL
jgi:hypothetical protein